jgi:N-acetylglucosaminyldiphosphoundecaprenol N-acetyl-beta-D-mannosaminyltransferase
LTADVAGPEERWELLGAPVDPVDLAGALQRVQTWLTTPGGALRHVVTVNPEFIMAARRDPRFAAVLSAADLATPDGVGVTLAARLLGQPIRGRVTGVDLVEGLARLEDPNVRIFLLGAAEGVAAAAAATLRERFPTVRVVGAFAGDASRQGFSEIERRLRATNPTVLLVAFGHPKQDLWINGHREALSAHGILVATGVGGAFDYLSGNVPRAPRLMRSAGLEWLYRLVRQPWRWRRQAVLPVFALLVGWTWLQRQAHSGRSWIIGRRS